MDWKTYFNERSLHKGLALWKAKSVISCNAAGDLVTGRVKESGRVYMTSVNLSEGFHASCSCPNAAMGMRCAHMAALLYARDAQLHKQIDVHKPLFDARKDARCYFDLARIFKDVRFPSEMVRQARILVMDKSVIFDGVQTSYWSHYGLRDSSEQSLIIDGHIGTDDYPRKVQVVVTHDHYVGGTCDEDYIYPTYASRLCAHQLALLLLAEETIQHFNLGDATDYGADQFLTAFAEKRTSRRLKEIGTKNNVIQLKPRLTVTEDGKLELGMKIGTGKLYLVKDMSALLDQKDSGETVKLGKNNEINFGMQDFVSEDEKYFNFLRTQIQESRAEFARFTRRYYDAYTYSRPAFPGIKNRMELSDHTLDVFFDTAEGDVIEFADKRKNGSSASSLQLKDGQAKLKLSIETDIDADRNVQSVQLYLPRSEVFHGSRYYYAISGSTIYRLPEKEAEMLDTMGLGSNGADSIRIGMRRLSEFYYHILPILQQSGYFDIQEDDKVAEIVPQEGTYDFYLDRHDDVLTLSAQVSFGDVSYRIIDDHWNDYENSPLRDHTYEREILDTVQLYYPDYDRDHHQFTADADDDTVYSILSEGVKALMMLGEVHVTDAFDKLRIRRTPVVSIGVRTENNLLDLSIATHDMSEEDLLALLDSYKQKKKYHRLSNGDFIELDQNDSLDVLSALFDTMNISLDEFTNGKMQLPLYRALYINKLLEEHDSVAADRDRTFRNLIRNFENVRNSDYEVPSSLQDTMRSYQIYGTEWMHTLLTCGFGGILADDMGLGKTLETIALLLSRREEGIQKPSLVITPASVVYNWVEEFKRFAPQMKVIAVAGTAKTRNQLLNQKADVFVTSYDLLKHDIKSYQQYSFDVEVIDEAQNIKNPGSAAAKSVKIIPSDHRFALTGTPIENRLSELWSIFDYLMPGFLFTYDTFKSRFETPIARNKDEAVTQHLRRMVSPLILRRLKKDVLKDLPDKMEETVFAKFDADQQKLYDAQTVHMKHSLLALQNGDSKNKLQILAELTKLREICCDPRLIATDYTKGSAKLDTCMELIESAMDGGHKMLVFSQFTSMLALIEEELQSRHIAYDLITGATPKLERQRLCHSFNNDDTPVFLISLKAGGTGLNLTGADVVIHYDPWWNLAAQNQATDRAHRIGQEHNVTVYKLIAQGTIEERIMELQNTKKDLADAILNGETASLASLSAEELMELIG